LVKKYHAAIKIRVDTNGQAQLFYKDRNVIDELKRAGVDRVSVSLNAHNQQIYDQFCKPEFENAYTAVLNFIEAAKEEFDTEVTAVTIPEAGLLRIEQIASDWGSSLGKETMYSVSGDIL
jgi:TatD family-associated radical SAM protein